RSASLAVLVTTRVPSWLMIWVAGTARTGARFTSFTITAKLLLSLNGGVPLSVTLTVIRFVLGPCASVGVQVNTPLLGSTVTPAGPDTRVRVSGVAGRSVSVAQLVRTNALSSLSVWSGGTVTER